MISERSVWDSALRDILDTIPFPHITRALPSMSTSSLISCTMRLIHQDLAFPAPGPVGRHLLARYPDFGDILHVLLLPGAQWVLVLTALGELRLYPFKTLVGLPTCYVEGHSDILPGMITYRAEMHLSLSSVGNTRILVSEQYEAVYVIFHEFAQTRN